MIEDEFSKFVRVLQARSKAKVLAKRKKDEIDLGSDKHQGYLFESE